MRYARAEPARRRKFRAVDVPMHLQKKIKRMLSEPRSGKVLARCASGIFAAVMLATPPVTVVAQENSSPPNFSSSQYGWVRVGTSQDYEAVPGTVPPVSSDPAHPFTGNNTGRQTTYRIADLSNPNLTPWVKERMKKDNDEVLAGKTAFTARQSCLPAGVPAFVTYGGDSPVWFTRPWNQRPALPSPRRQAGRLHSRCETST